MQCCNRSPAGGRASLQDCIALVKLKMVGPCLRARMKERNLISGFRINSALTRRLEAVTGRAAIAEIVLFSVAATVAGYDVINLERSDAHALE